MKCPWMTFRFPSASDFPGRTSVSCRNMTADDFEVDPPVTIAEVQEFCAIVKKSVPPAVFDSFV